MIKIECKEPEKLKDNILIKYCAFISFDYKQGIVDYIKKLPTRFYHADIHTWEVPINDLVKFCNTFEDEEITITGNCIKLNNDIDIEIPKGFEFKTKPFPHQIDGVKFGLSHNKFLLCDEQGLGKTKEIIDWIMCLDKIKPIKHALIICGVNSLKYNWQNEISTHSNEKAYVLGTRQRKNGKICEGGFKERMEDLDNLPTDCKFIITNIESLRTGAEKISRGKYNFPIAEKIKELCDNGDISVIAFDECHTARNPVALQNKAMQLLQTPYMCAMTGTPLMNNPLDLYFPLNWLGYENHSFYMFKNHYCRMGGWGNAQVVGFKNLDELKNNLEHIMLRRLKNEVLDLPEKIHQIEYVDMTPKQVVIYKEVEQGIRTNINKIMFSNNPLAMLTRLRQVTGYTGIVSDKIQESAKINRLLELVQELHESGQKAVIFSNWTSITEVLKEKLKQYNPAYITGETDNAERMKEVDRFQNDKKCEVIIGTIGAMGTGLTLTASQTVIFMDSPWTYALKAQAEDRAYRIGTKGTVNVITLCTKNTIDERIEELIEKKKKIGEAIVDSKITLEELNFLLS